MSRTLVLAEKPSQAENYAKALGGMTGSFEGQPYTIRALRGHVMQYPKDPSTLVPKSREEYYKTWSLDTLPWDPEDFRWKKQPIPEGRKALDALAAALGEVDSVTIATDVDPSGEGELLAWEALEECGWRGPTWRMYHADESPKSVQKAFRERKQLPSMEEDGDWRKADCRAKWDYLSMQLTRSAVCSLRKARGSSPTMRQGRLKSVMVWLVGEQEDANANYRKVPFFEARFRDEKGNVFAVKDSKDRFPKKEDVPIGQYEPSPVVEDGRTRKRRQPPKPLDLAGISAALAARGFKPKQVLDTYQQMYNDHILSYPRTEDKTVTPEQFEELLPLVDRICTVVHVDPTLISQHPRAGFVKEGAAHGANRPGTTVPSSLDSLEKYGPAAAAIYELTAKSYLATMAEDCEYLQIRAHLLRYTDFTATLDVVQKLGYRAVYDDADDNRKKDAPDGFGRMAEPFVFEGCNKRPPKPTMKWLKERLEKYDVGTGATRTSTIADITAEGGRTEPLMHERKGVLSLSDAGKASHIILKGCMIASPEATEKLQAAMREVGAGKLDEDTVISSITDLVRHDTQLMQANARNVPPSLLHGGTGAAADMPMCPKCGQPMRKAKSGKIWFCSSKKGHVGKDGKFVLDDEGCGYKIATTIRGKKISDAQVRALLSGKTIKIAGLVSRSTGKTYAAEFRADPEDEWGTKMVRFVSDGKRDQSPSPSRSGKRR